MAIALPCRGPGSPVIDVKRPPASSTTGTIAGEFDVKVWDLAAIVPVVEEAGGRFTSITGEPGPRHGNAIATNGRLHDTVLGVLAK